MPGNCYTEALPSRRKKYFVILFLLLTRGHFITASTAGVRTRGDFWDNLKPFYSLKMRGNLICLTFHPTICILKSYQVIEREAKPYIVCENASDMVKSIVDDSIIAKIAISQNEKGIDKEDRVQKLKNYLGSKTIP